MFKSLSHGTRLPRLLRGLGLAAVLVVGATTAVTAAPADPFKGSWSALDLDGSRMTVAFSGSGSVREVTWSDDRATCLGGEALVLSGLGTIEGSTISGSFGVICDTEIGFAFTHDPEAGTLAWDSVTWQRGDAGPDAFGGVWIAEDIDGSFMQLTLEGSGLTREVSYHDHGASVCGEVVDGEGIDWTSAGTGTIGSSPGLGAFLFVSSVGGCAGSAKDTPTEAIYEYDHASNQLIDDFGITWSRKD
jgi:hypothetical protein